MPSRQVAAFHERHAALGHSDLQGAEPPLRRVCAGEGDGIAHEEDAIGGLQAPDERPELGIDVEAVGDELDAGQRIGTLGSVDQKPALLFEIRAGRSTLNTAEWFGI